MHFDLLKELYRMVESNWTYGTHKKLDCPDRCVILVWLVAPDNPVRQFWLSTKLLVGLHHEVGILHPVWQTTTASTCVPYLLCPSPLWSNNADASVSADGNLFWSLISVCNTISDIIRCWLCTQVVIITIHIKVRRDLILVGLGY
jgi:hypothetical protein